MSGSIGANWSSVALTQPYWTPTSAALCLSPGTGRRSRTRWSILLMPSRGNLKLLRSEVPPGKSPVCNAWVCGAGAHITPVHSCVSRTHLEGQFQSHLDLTSLVLLDRSDLAEARIRGIRIRPAEAHVIERVKGLEAVLQPYALSEAEVFEETDVDFIHARVADITEARRVAANKGREVLVYAVADALAVAVRIVVQGSAVIIEARHILNARPRRIVHD